MNTDKAYIMGLVTGGGCFSSDNKSFYIKLPYKQWGDFTQNPERAGLIAKDILKVVKPLMALEYGLDVSYTVGREWRIVCHGDVSSLIEDLEHFGIKPSSDLHKTADLSKIIDALIDTNLKKRFIAGIADTIGSMAPSHRRFSDDVQIISFEISGFNYKYVCQLCNVLYSLGCVPDQILWQHPNMQSGNDSYYTAWKKGNKLRVTLDSFSTFGSLAFKSKSRALKDNQLRETPGTYNAAEKCENKMLRVGGVVAVHVDENHASIPEEIRGGHYIHHKQICGALNCPHAPKSELNRLFHNAEYYISPFAVLHKDTIENINSIIENDELLSNRSYNKIELKIKELIDESEKGAITVSFKNQIPIYSYEREKGYPLNVIFDAAAFIIASRTGQLNGKRPRGNRDEIIRNAMNSNTGLTVTIKVPDLLTPIVITDDKMAAMVGPVNTEVYKKLITYSEENPYKMIVRNITEDDLV